MQCVKKNVVALIRSGEREVAAATAWEMPDIDAPVEPVEPELSEEEKARAEAWQQGYQEGLESGRAEGLQQGQQQGFEQGQQEGLALAQQEAEQLSQQIRQQAEQALSAVTPLVTSLRQPLEMELDNTVNRAIATLVVQIARQVVRQEMALRPEHIVDVVQHLFQQLPMTDREVRLHLHPEDKVLLEGVAPLIGSGFDWVMEADEEVKRGGCRISSRNFSADESVDNRLEESVRQVFGEVDLPPNSAPAESNKSPEPISTGEESTEIDATPVETNSADTDSEDAPQAASAEPPPSMENSEEGGEETPRES